jgi:hypothetical protein
MTPVPATWPNSIAVLKSVIPRNPRKIAHDFMKALDRVMNDTSTLLMNIQHPTKKQEAALMLRAKMQ